MLKTIESTKCLKKRIFNTELFQADDKFMVCEFLNTIQGEGLLQGIPSILVKLYGCNLKCKWCDNNEGISEYVIMCKEEILKRLQEVNCRYAIISGGEPTLYKGLNGLILLLKQNGIHVTVETNSTIITQLDCDLVSMSPKLAHSQDNNIRNIQFASRINFEAINYYIMHNNYQIKFVCRNTDEDFQEVISILSKLDKVDWRNVMIMPLAATRQQLYEIQQELVRLCIKYNLRYMNRLQLQIWDVGKEG